MTGFRAIPSILFASAVLTAQPVKSVWIQGLPIPGSTAAASKIRPDVHSVEFTNAQVIVRSAGLSLAYLGPLESSPQPRNEPREYIFRFPLNPRRETDRHAHVPAEYVGAFVNGVPIYNQFEAASYLGQNLWHYDLIARRDNGTHLSRTGLLEGLIPNSGQHSPIIGYAFDGFPIYGPWGATAEGLRRMRSSYRLRQIANRGQSGPPVNNEYPLGTFVEDYEYVAGWGDLDQYNGRVTKTPDYPEGTYAYFLTTAENGRLAFPYLLAHEYYGRYLYANRFSGEHTELQFRAANPLLSGHAAALQFVIPDKFRNPIRHLEYVHERPIHLLIVSLDLQEFAHVHPEVNEYGVWEVTHTFAHGGKYRLYADFTPPGENRRVEKFDVTVQATSTPSPVKTSTHVPITLEAATPLRANVDIELLFKLGSIAGLQPYLGAWAHAVIAGENLSSFSHAHPLEEGDSPIKQSEMHLHTPEALGPAPNQIRIATSFPAAGLYKIWLQLQIVGKVVTVPFVVNVAPPERVQRVPIHIPADGIRVAITANGYEPRRIVIPDHRPVSLVFSRTTESNCGSKVVFPNLGISKDIPLGGVAIVDLPPLPAGELRFTCGMGMYRGSIVAVRPPGPK